VEHVDGELMLDPNVMFEFFRIALYSFLEHRLQSHPQPVQYIELRYYVELIVYLYSSYFIHSLDAIYCPLALLFIVLSLASELLLLYISGLSTSQNAFFLSSQIQSRQRLQTLW